MLKAVADVGMIFQKQLCELNVELGVERFCVEKEDSSVNTGAEAIAAATELEVKTETEAKAVIEVVTAAEEEDICCEAFRKLDRGLRWALYCLELKDSPEDLGEEADSATEAATELSAGI